MAGSAEEIVAGLKVAAAIVPAMLLGTWAGGRAFSSMDPCAFSLLVMALLVCSALFSVHAGLS